jgi:hypothetical protein
MAIRTNRHRAPLPLRTAPVGGFGNEEQHAARRISRRSPADVRSLHLHDFRGMPGSSCGRRQSTHACLSPRSRLGSPLSTLVIHTAVDDRMSRAGSGTDPWACCRTSRGPHRIDVDRLLLSQLRLHQPERGCALTRRDVAICTTEQPERRSFQLSQRRSRVVTAPLD